MDIYLLLYQIFMAPSIDQGLLTLKSFLNMNINDFNE